MYKQDKTKSMIKPQIKYVVTKITKYFTPRTFINFHSDKSKQLSV